MFVYLLLQSVHFVCSQKIWGASLMAQTVKNVPAVQETCIRSLCWEDRLEEGMTAPSSILAGEPSWPEEPGGLQSWGRSASHD